MTEIKSGAICLLFSYILCLGSAFFFASSYWYQERLLFIIFSFSHMFHVFVMYCIRVRHRRRGSGAFWISVAICNTHLVVIKKFIQKTDPRIVWCESIDVFRNYLTGSRGG